MAGDAAIYQTDPFSFLTGNIFTGKKKFPGFRRTDEILNEALSFNEKLA